MNPEWVVQKTTRSPATGQTGSADAVVRVLATAAAKANPRMISFLYMAFS
jgi:hypothetical protein